VAWGRCTRAESAGDLIPVPTSTTIDGVCCSSARRSVSAAIDDEASAGELLAAALHVAGCEACRRFVVEIVGVARVLRSSEQDHLDRRGWCGWMHPY
jgi:putative zinc finger protein